MVVGRRKHEDVWRTGSDRLASGFFGSSRRVDDEMDGSTTRMSQSRLQTKILQGMNLSI